MSHPQCPHGAQPSGTGMKGSSVGTLWMELMAPGAAVPPRPSVCDQNTSHSEGCCELRWGGGGHRPWHGDAGWEQHCPYGCSEQSCTELWG